MGCSTYLNECIRKIEAHPRLGDTLFPHKTHLPADVHPELDDYPLLDTIGTRDYKMLMGMAQWDHTLVHLDISYAVSSLSRFSVTPRELHLKLALHLFGYLKKHPNRCLVMDSRPLNIDDELIKNPTFHPDFLEDYEGAMEEVDEELPEPYGDELETSCFFDSDDAHDIETRCSITGLIGFVGSTPVFLCLCGKDILQLPLIVQNL